MADKRVVLAYSGGLDTSVAVRWLTEERQMEVVAVAVDVGQGGDLEAARARALAAGAVAAEVIDAREEFAHGFVLPALKANALYERRYPLVSALSRPLIARHLVDAAHRHGAGAVAHGCTGKGNDQVRFEVSIRALDPELDLVAPVREWGMSRQDAIDYAERFGIPVEAKRDSPYSVDQNLWGRAVECGVLEDPWVEPPPDVLELTVPTASTERQLVVGFEAGVPVALDGQRLGLVELIGQLGAVVGSYGWGRIDLVESRRVGIKSREFYECPAALALIMAHCDLEALTLERDLLHEKVRLEPRWAELVYDGLWYSPLKAALDAFVEASQEAVTGEVRLGCSPEVGCFVAGRRSPVGLYELDLATYEATDRFRHQDAEGFVRLWGLGVQTWARAREATRRQQAGGSAAD